MSLNRKQLGAIGEEKAATLLLDNGYQIIDRNWRCPFGELDIVMKDGTTIVFVEVRTRTIYGEEKDARNKYGTIYDAVHVKKQQQLRKLSHIYVHQNRLYNDKLRFDVVLVEVKEQEYKLKHIINAF